ncbi:ABC transporter substrate-binding protein [Kribbella jejuensis]|uniref:Iron complex transport system substrate-binding protein n=1 Tax=Kribbella jejuensis TaxID=236068 RepID=A0A542DUQ9_9ACTN|nr:ABC transporter substrate-binding protein [Kribbella jejuensis]TQJ06704.1 iron complex transport system substrate-binding protein [Kribbella jejuensis]
MRPVRLLAYVLVLGVAGCGGSPGTSTEIAATAGPGRTSYPLTVENCGLKQTFSKPPSRVVILNGTSVGEAESFVMLGLQQHVLANGQSYGVSDDPGMVAKVNALPKTGLSMNKNFDVPAEQVLALKPDLVISTWSGGFDASSGFATREQLAAVGAATIVNPVNCAFGNPRASAAEKATYEAQGIESSYAFLALLGQIFDVQQKAADTIAVLRSRIDAVRAKVQGAELKRVAIVYPGMSMMNENGLPAVMTGGIYDDVIKAAGGVNAFAGESADATRTINAEQLAAARVDVLVVGAFTPNERPTDEAAKLLKQFPQWPAAQSNTFTTVADGAYLGPLNVYVIEKIAKAAHPDRF